MASPVNDSPASFEQLAATQSNIGRMRAAGVKVALGIDGVSQPLDNHQTRLRGRYSPRRDLPEAYRP